MQNLERRWFDGAVRDGDTAFDTPINMRPVPVPYSRVARPLNHFWQTRPWITYKDIEISEGIFGGEITDIIELDGIMYFMRINDNNDTIKIFRSVDWGCTLEKIVNEPFDAAYAGEMRKFTVIDFVRWNPRRIYEISWVEQTTTLGNAWTQINNNYNGVSTWYFYNDYTGTDFNVGTWPNQIHIWDYIYTFRNGSSTPPPTCDDEDEYTNGYCGQVRQIICDTSGSNDKLWVESAREWFDLGLMNGNTQVRPPQTRGENMDYYIFPEIWATFIFPVSGGARAFHYYDSGTNTTISTEYCNFTTWPAEWFTDILAHEGSFWRINVFFNKRTNAIVSSLPNTGGAFINDYYSIDPDINWITQFQKYILYFWPRSIGAMYFQEITTSQWTISGYIAKGNTIRKNLGAWTNSNGVSDTFDEFNDWFFFLASNKEIYWLSVIFNEWELTSKIESIHDTWWREIYGELQALQEGDDVFIRGWNDTFCVYINHQSGWTKILRYWKKQKKWSIDVICCAKLTDYKFDVFMGDWIYHLCGDTDCNNNTVPSKIPRWFGEAGDWITPMSQYNIWPLIIQLGNVTAVQGGLKLKVYSHRNTYKPVLTLDLDNLPYTELLASIASWATTDPSECKENKLGSCEGRDDPCYGNLPPIVQKTPCSCESRPDDANYCQCYENKAYFLSEFANILAELSIKGSLFRFELSSNGVFSFGWFTMWFNQDSNYKGWFNQTEIVRCENC